MPEQQQPTIDQLQAELARLRERVAELEVHDQGRAAAEAAVLLRDQAIAHSSCGVTIADARLPNMPLIYVNGAFEQITGYSAAEMLGRNCRFLQGDDTDQPELHELRAALRAGERCAVELRNYRVDGTLFWNYLQVAPIRDAAGAISHFVGIQTDVTARKRAEQELAERTAELSAANAALAQAAQSKDSFLANMSHELRTPLNAILGMTEILHEGMAGALNQRQTESVQTIDASSRHLLALINDILDISKVEAGTLELLLGQVALDPLCQTCLRFVVQQAAAKQITIALRVAPDAGSIMADERRLKQILVNLLSNAVKFTPARGSIGLEVLVDQAHDQAQLTVWDTGIGIAGEHLRQIFEPFVQLDRSLARQHEGAGLGLAMVRRLAELHGGTVVVQSVLGQGSRFTVSLPARRSQLVSAPSALLSDAGGPARAAAGHILVAEDNEANGAMVQAYLLRKGFEVTLVGDGLEVLAQSAVRRPDLILMDVQMPQMDGLTTIEHLRRRPDTARLPIIAVTALAMPEDRARCLAAGASEYLSKPINLKQLHRMISELLADHV